MLAKSPPIKTPAVRGSQGCNLSMRTNSRTIAVGRKKRGKANAKFNEQTTDAECIYDGIKRDESSSLG